MAAVYRRSSSSGLLSPRCAGIPARSPFSSSGGSSNMWLCCSWSVLQTALGVHFAAFNIKADRLSVLRTSFPEELMLTAKSVEGRPKVISMVAFRCATASAGSILQAAAACRAVCCTAVWPGVLAAAAGAACDALACQLDAAAWLLLSAQHTACATAYFCQGGRSLLLLRAACRANVRSEARYAVSFEPDVTTGTGFVSSLSLIAKLGERHSSCSMMGIITGCQGSALALAQQLGVLSQQECSPARALQLLFRPLPPLAASSIAGLPVACTWLGFACRQRLAA